MPDIIQSFVYYILSYLFTYIAIHVFLTFHCIDSNKPEAGIQIEDTWETAGLIKKQYNLLSLKTNDSFSSTIS